MFRMFPFFFFILLLFLFCILYFILCCVFCYLFSEKQIFFDCFARSTSEMFAALEQQGATITQNSNIIQQTGSCANKMRVWATSEVVKVIKMTIFGGGNRKR